MHWPVCTRFALVISNICATTSPSRWSSTHWYFYITTNFAVSCHSKLSGTQQCKIPNWSSRVCTISSFFVTFSWAWQRAVSVMQVESLDPTKKALGTPNDAEVTSQVATLSFLQGYQPHLWQQQTWKKAYSAVSRSTSACQYSICSVSSSGSCFNPTR